MPFYWNPAPLNAAIARAYAASLQTAEADAKAHAPSSRAGVELSGTSLVPRDLGTVFEQGRKGGYEIQPQGKALKFPGGTFAAFAKGGPMSARPFIRPAAQRWASGGFQSTARTTLNAAGF